MTIENYEQILTWVNSIRAIYGAEPLTELVKGLACNGNHCPLANSLVSEAHGVYQVDMSYDHFTLYTSYKLEYQGDKGMSQVFELEDGKAMYTFWGTIPDYIRDFLVQIDDNQHPDLADKIIDEEDSKDEEYMDEAEVEYYEQTFLSGREWEEYHGNDYWEEDEEWWDDSENDYEGW
jgi:hypothetical protein